MRCRALTDDAERLDCFDRTTATMEQALRTGEVLFVKRAAVQAARQSRFGLPEPSGDLLGGEDPAELSGIIRSVRSSAEGWLIVLQDGSAWQQVGASAGVVEPRAGLEVTIKRGALGSYRLVFSSHAFFKVKRVR